MLFFALIESYEILHDKPEKEDMIKSIEVIILIVAYLHNTRKKAYQKLMEHHREKMEKAGRNDPLLSRQFIS